MSGVRESGDATVGVYRWDGRVALVHDTCLRPRAWRESAWSRVLPDDVDDALLGACLLEAMYPGAWQAPVGGHGAHWPRALGARSEGQVMDTGGQAATIAQRGGGPVFVETLHSHGSRGWWERRRGDFSLELAADPEPLELAHAVRAALDASHRRPPPHPGHT